MTRTVWLKADSDVGDWETRRRRITAGLEAGVDWVLVDEGDVERVRELGQVNVAAFANGDVHVMDAGAAGVSMGRSIFQHENPEKIARAVASVVHDDAAAEDALREAGLAVEA